MSRVRFMLPIYPPQVAACSRRARGKESAAAIEATCRTQRRLQALHLSSTEHSEATHHPSDSASNVPGTPTLGLYQPRACHAVAPPLPPGAVVVRLRCGAHDRRG